MNIKNKKDKTNRGFIWYSLRISFWVMILAYLSILYSSHYYESYLFKIKYKLTALAIILKYLISSLAIIQYISIIFTFIVSIVHLFKYKQKIFAIISLVISSSIILFLIWIVYYFFNHPIII